MDEPRKRFLEACYALRAEQPPERPVWKMLDERVHPLLERYQPSAAIKPIQLAEFTTPQLDPSQTIESWKDRSLAYYRLYLDVRGESELHRLGRQPINAGRKKRASIDERYQWAARRLMWRTPFKEIALSENLATVRRAIYKVFHELGIPGNVP